MHLCDRYHCSHAYSLHHSHTQADPARKGESHGGGGGGGEREHFLLWKLSLLALLKRGKEEGKGGVVCPSLDSQQNKRFMGGVDSCILMENGQCFGR